MNLALSTRRRVFVVGALSATTVLATASMAAAAPQHVAKKPKHPTTTTVTYAVVGSSLVAKPNSTVALGPTTLTTAVTGSGSFTGTLPIPPAQATFKVLGLLPVSATVSFLPTAPVTGQLTFSTAGVAITSMSQYTLQLSNVTIAGLPANVGSTCETSAPVAIDPASTVPFASLTSGGTLAGTYTIGDFANCGLTTSLINLLVPGTGNTVSLTLSDGAIQP